MKDKVSFTVLLLLGISIVAYPYVSNYLSEKNGSYVTETYKDDIKKMKEAERKALLEKAKAYNRFLVGLPVHDPFIPGAGVEMPKEYYEALNIKGVMGKIEIPKIGVKLPFYHGTSEKVLKKSIGHLEGTSLPIGGKDTHAVLTGHTGLPNIKLFTDLADLEKRDQFLITVVNKTMAYEVDQIKIVEPQETNDLRRDSEKDLVTLLTCTPYGVNSHRLLVRGHRVPYDPAKKQKKNGLSAENRRLLMIALITGACMGLLILIMYLIKRWREKQQKGSGDDEATVEK